jgi:hypothetical protein
VCAAWRFDRRPLDRQTLGLASTPQPVAIGPALAVAELAVRYPITVFALEALFRSWLQPRLGRNGHRPTMSGSVGVDTRAVAAAIVLSGVGPGEELSCAQSNIRMKGDFS